MVWLGLELILPKPQVNQPAIDAYAQGVGQAYVGRHEEAIVSFDQAVALFPEYANAYNERANSYYSLGDYQRAAEDFEQARAAGRDDINVHWNLGWTYYLLGNYEQAIQANKEILDSNPSVLGMRMNQALTYLVMGDRDNAQREYDFLIAEAERQVTEAHAQGTEPSASLWYYMDAGAIDLQNLIDELDGNRKWWTYAPPADLVRGDRDQVREFAYLQMQRIKESILALEYTGALPQGQTTMQVTPFRFGQETYDEQGNVTGFEDAPNATFPYGTESVTVYFEYSGEIPQQALIWKIYQNGAENQSLRDIWSDTDISESTGWYKFIGFSYTRIFILTAGEYIVELYADSKLVQRGTFYIEEPQ
jgi:tetratricopeptide (TPR) repeat protein